MWYSFLVIVIFISQNIEGSSLEHDGVLEIALEHALNFNENLEPVFKDRGNISVQSIRIGAASINQKPLSTEDSKLLKRSAELNQFYQIRASPSGSDKKFISTVKACMLAESQLDDRLSVSLDYAGRVVAVSEVIASKSSCEGALQSLDKLKFFVTNVHVRHPENGPIPDTASYIQRLEREREAKERGEGKDNRSFLAKYWMYIVPVVVIMVLSSASNADNAGAATSS